MKPNWNNQTIWTGDNLPILRGLNSESVDLIYLDRRSTPRPIMPLPLEAGRPGPRSKIHGPSLTWMLSGLI